MSDPTPALVATKATVSNAINLNDLAVIGLFHNGNEPVALLRSAQGEIARVQAGMQVFDVFITAIGDTQILVTDTSGRTETLVVAGG